MTPIETPEERGKCSKKTSSNCIVWDGPDIPCINLCKGDSITNVVYKLGTYLCGITPPEIDISSLDLGCFNDETPPESLLELLQDLINAACTAQEGGEETPAEVENIALPVCLYYTDGEGDTITSLPPDEYASYIATKMCDVISDITSINATILVLQGQITEIYDLLDDIVIPTTFDVEIQCILGTPGNMMSIIDAVEGLENQICTMLSMYGGSSTISDIIDIATSFTDQVSMEDSDDNMGDIPGWIDEPGDLSQSTYNLWLAYEDLRNRVIDCCGEGTVGGCSPLPVTNIQISNLTQTSALVSWTAPAVGVLDYPTGYLVKVYNTSGGSPVGSPIYSAIVSYPLNSITLPGYTVGTNYYVSVSALYRTCGESPIEYVTGSLATDNAGSWTIINNCSGTDVIGVTINTISIGVNPIVAGAALPLDAAAEYITVYNPIGVTPGINTVVLTLDNGSGMGTANCVIASVEINGDAASYYNTQVRDDDSGITISNFNLSVGDNVIITIDCYEACDPGEVGCRTVDVIVTSTIASVQGSIDISYYDCTGSVTTDTIDSNVDGTADTTQICVLNGTLPTVTSNTNAIYTFSNNPVNDC